MSNKEKRLFEVAEGQQGCCTAGQAVECGYPTSSHVTQSPGDSARRAFASNSPVAVLNEGLLLDRAFLDKHTMSAAIGGQA